MDSVPVISRPWKNDAKEVGAAEDIDEEVDPTPQKKKNAAKAG